MANKKIINANPNEYNGINFKSDAERRTYQALLAAGIEADYEAHTFVLSPRVRSTVPFYNRTKAAGFHLITEPIPRITYTPDFTFTLNGVFVIIEVKGFENDVFPLKRNLFRKYLETVDYPVMYFEIRSKKELLQALGIVNMENHLIQTMRKLIPSLPERDIPIGTKLLASRDFDNLQDLVDSAISKVKKDRIKYADIDLDNLHRLSGVVSEYASKL